MIFVDTGFLLALSQPEDGLHQRAAAWSRAVTERLIVTEYVLWETVNFLSKPIDRPKAHRLLDHLRNSTECGSIRSRSALVAKPDRGVAGP